MREMLVNFINHKENMLHDHHELREKMNKEIVDVELALDDKTIVQLSLAAHENKMTLNDFIVKVIDDKIKESDYRFENGNKPQLLNETE